MRTGLVLLGLLTARLHGQSAITGTVRGDDGLPVEAVSVNAVRADRSVARDAVTDARGVFRLTTLSPGVYTVTARKIGYRSAELLGIRVAEGQTLSLSVAMTRAPRQLSTIRIVTSPTSIDASTPELSLRLDRHATALLPTARTASSLIALVPGARKDQLWGGVPGVSNDYQLDGVSMNHPGVGGDFLSLSVDWIESLDIRGLGAGAEHGNFQGGIINAVTRTGSNERRYAVRANYEAPELTATNLDLNELGVEQAGRREIGAEALGPIARDRLFYFVAGQYVDRRMRSPNLVTPTPFDFQRVREEQADARLLAKVTWLPALAQRVDLLAGFSGMGIEHAGINGVDDASATLRVDRPITYYGLYWNNSASSRNQVDLRLAGFKSRESRTGYEGPGVPGVQLLQAGRQPKWQNATFDERREPSNVAASGEWRTRRHLWTDHQLVIGGEVSRGRWSDERTRNGGLTWRPYSSEVSGFDPNDVRTWRTVGSDWGGDIRLDSDVASEALFVQDYLSIGSRVTLTPGVRYGRWRGYIRPTCAPDAECRRFEAVRATGIDPRFGIAWDVTGRNTFAVKAHWGRYHQGMYSLFFDRVEGANVYSNQRFYSSAPPLPTAKATFTPAQRDSPGSGFPAFYDEMILDVAGRVDGYKQPYVDQAVLALEKSFGPAWKGEMVYTHRRNGDIVGLEDRNLASNYTPIRNVYVDHRYVRGLVLDAKGRRLVLPQLYASNQDILRALARLRTIPPTLFGYGSDYLSQLTWDPDVVLTAIPEARRRYDQVTLMLRTVQPGWRAEGSLTGARLKGNVPGVTGYGTTATRFSAGPFVNPNEGINGEGFLPDALQMEAKVWATVRLPYRMEGGLVYTHILGERFAPTFEIHGRY
ncbi:MAG: TonB-dependent receptor, partial [Gemmatimonadota bacterium]|nr:TonB-dependent receptor [Gemmatimonadota bacterium]